MGLPDGTEDRPVGAFLDIVPGRDTDRCCERRNLAAGVTQDCYRGGIVSGRQQSPRTVQKRLSRSGDNHLTANSSFELART
jgi:hypothetical protein